MSEPHLNDLIEVLNRVTPPARVLAHCVPTRIIRVIDVYDDQCTYHVEQLIQHTTADGFTAAEWKPLSSHTNKTPGGSLKIAFLAAFAAQKNLIIKVREAQQKTQQVARGVLDATNQVTPATVTKL
jgi:hypothetical protein